MQIISVLKMTRVWSRRHPFNHMLTLAVSFLQLIQSNSNPALSGLPLVSCQVLPRPQTPDHLVLGLVFFFLSFTFVWINQSSSHGSSVNHKCTSVTMPSSTTWSSTDKLVHADQGKLWVQKVFSSPFSTSESLQATFKCPLLTKWAVLLKDGSAQTEQRILRYSTALTLDKQVHTNTGVEGSCCTFCYSCLIQEQFVTYKYNGKHFSLLNKREALTNSKR